MTDAELIEQIEDEIAEITTALSFIRSGGQSYTIETGSSKRTVTNVDYDLLVQQRRDLNSQLQTLNGEGGLTLGAGW